MSQKDIRSHVGKHLEEVALMTLPEEDEDESDRFSNSDRETLNPHESLVGEALSSAGCSSGKCPSRIVGGKKQLLQRPPPELVMIESDSMIATARWLHYLWRMLKSSASPCCSALASHQWRPRYASIV